MDNLQPPKTIEEVGIHMVYMAKAIQSLNEKLDAYSTNFVPNNIFLVYQENMSEKIRLVEERLAKLEINQSELHDFIQKWSGKVWGINSTIAIVTSGLLWVINILIQRYWK